MNEIVSSYVFVALTIALSVYCQLVMKWQVNIEGPAPEEGLPIIRYIIRVLRNPWIASGWIAAIFSALTWMAALSKLDLSHAYPFMALNFVFVALLSGSLFHEPITMRRMLGTTIIVLGLIISSQG